MKQSIIDLYDRFTHGALSRRDFMERLTLLAGSTAAANGLLPLLQNNYALAQMVPPADQRLRAERVAYEAQGRKLGGYVARPAQPGKYPAVIVVHENRGLNPHIEDIARRLGIEGFLALAVDLLSSAGGTPSDEDKARDLQRQLRDEDIAADLLATVAYLSSHPESTGKVGAIGFCWGGGQVNELAAASPELDAAVAYYGDQVSADRVAQIKAPLLLHYAGLDQRVNAGIEGFEQALKANGKTYQIHMYEGANHAFNNETNAARYNKAAADLAWQRTIAFLKQHLGETAKG